MGMSKTLSRLQQAQEERGQQEAQAVTCGQPAVAAPSTGLHTAGCPAGCGWAPVARSAAFPLVHPHSPHPLCLQLPLSRPPLSSSQATSSTLAWPGENKDLLKSLFPSTSPITAHLAAAFPSHPAPGALTVSHHATLNLGLLGEQQVPCKGSHRPHPQGCSALEKGPRTGAQLC